MLGMCVIKDQVKGKEFKMKDIGVKIDGFIRNEKRLIEFNGIF